MPPWQYVIVRAPGATPASSSSRCISSAGRKRRVSDRSTRSVHSRCRAPGTCPTRLFPREFVPSHSPSLRTSSTVHAGESCSASRSSALACSDGTVRDSNVRPSGRDPWNVTGRPSVSQRCQPPFSTFAFVCP